MPDYATDRRLRGRLTCTSTTAPASPRAFYYADVDFDYAARPTSCASASWLGRDAGRGRKTPNEYAYVTNVGNTGLSYQMNGLYKPGDVSFPGYANTGNYNDPHLFLAYDGLNKVKSTDQETYFQSDAEVATEAGILDAIKFGLRLTNHQRSVLDYYNDGCQAQVPDDTYTQCVGTTAVLERPGREPLRPGPGRRRPASSSNIWQLSPGQITELRQRAGRPARVVAALFLAQQLRGQRADAGPLRHGQARGRPSGRATPACGRAAQQVAHYNEGADAATPGEPVSEDPHNGDYIHCDHHARPTRPAAQHELQRSTSRRGVIGRVAASRTMTRADYTDLAGAGEPERPERHRGSGGNPQAEAGALQQLRRVDGVVLRAPGTRRGGRVLHGPVVLHRLRPDHRPPPNLRQNLPSSRRPPIPTRWRSRSTTRARTRASSSPGSSRSRGASAANLNYTYAVGRDSNRAPLAGSLAPYVQRRGLVRRTTS